MKRAASQSASTDDDNMMHNEDETTTEDLPQRHDCALTVIRSLTEPCLFPPTLDELHDALTVPWNIRVPISSTDHATRQNWSSQKQTTLFHRMFDWEPSDETSTASIGQYFSFGTSFLLSPWQDVGKSLKQLLMNEVACRNKGEYFILSSQGLDLFIATGPNFPESWFSEVVIPHVEGDRVLDSHYYLLRCHQDKAANKLVLGYHCHAANPQDDSHTFPTFHIVHEILLRDEDWRLQACVVVTNLARILHCLKDYAVPLIWKNSTKLRLVTSEGQDGVPEIYRIQKSYVSDRICPVFHATVGNMIDMYGALEKAKIPHTDRLVSVEHDRDRTICKFAPVGRTYPPMNIEELLDALICVSETLIAMHSLGIMHRDIRWANIFHAIQGGSSQNDPVYFTREWVLFDFEFAAMAPQSAFAAHTLTPGNHAPEMVDTDSETHSESHGTAVDIWGLGYLMQHAFVDVPVSHKSDLEQLQSDCLETNPTLRPKATECLERLLSLQARPRSKEVHFEHMKITTK
mmetsp:Transcript_18568/g.35301  ORF Transcript_18568/g.35301 Transcript_18568/m.35301 type:complete len:517 (+) Transcript_18568:136-1686(+)